MTHFFSDIMEGKGEGGGRAVQVVKINDEDEEHSFTLGQTNKRSGAHREHLKARPETFWSI